MFALPATRLNQTTKAKAKVNRKDYGINYHQLLETGVAAVGEEVELDIDAEAIKDTARKNVPAK